MQFLLPWLVIFALLPSCVSDGGKQTPAVTQETKDKKMIDKTLRSDWTWGLNTSNPSKKRDFEDLFRRFGGVELKRITEVDLAEIDADPIKVVVHKASQLEEGIIVEDSSFDVEGAKIGVNVRWLIDNLKDLKGRKASLRTLIAFKVDRRVFVFEGEVKGQVVEPRGPVVKGFYINPYFEPEGRDMTLAEHSDDSVNPRAIAVKNLLSRKYLAAEDEISSWNGDWQH